MQLGQLLARLPVAPRRVEGRVDVDVTRVVHHGMRVVPGAVFVAVYHRGYAADRHEFIGQAVERGAVAVVVSRAVETPPGVTVVHVDDTAGAFGWLAAALHGVPSRQLALVGVTGTDGKTTTSTLTGAVLDGAGFVTGLATTVASKAAGEARANPHHSSTPEADEVQALLAETVRAGGSHAVLEATSHALDQQRLAGCEIDVAVVTRVTHEHMEYHGSYDNYIAAKAKLLDLLRPIEREPKGHGFPKVALLNADDSSFEYMAARAPVDVLPYGLGREARLRAVDVQPNEWGTDLRVVSPWGEGALALRMPGEFNVYNALAAIGAGCTLGAPFESALSTLAAQTGVRGRMERIDAGQPFTVIVDFAHTPDSLERVLTMLRARVAAAKGKVTVVFGSAGERDVQKRPWMGRIATEHADLAIFTDEDPRMEDSLKIIDEIAAGARAAGGAEGSTYLREPDRRAAIALAFQKANAGDAVLLAGKGHENSILTQLEGRLHTIAWDEVSVARELLNEAGYR